MNFDTALLVNLFKTRLVVNQGTGFLSINTDGRVIVNSMQVTRTRKLRFKIVKASIFAQTTQKG